MLRELKAARTAQKALVAAALAAGTIALAPAAPALADNCPNAEFRTGASAGLPDCRAYEQVSPSRKFSYGVIGAPFVAGASNSPASTPGWSSPDGNRMMMLTAGGPGAENAVRGMYYPQVWTRTDDGWTTRPAFNGPIPEAVLAANQAEAKLLIPNADRTGLIFTSSIPFSPGQPVDGHLNGNGGVHRASPDGTLTWVSRPPWNGADLPPGTNGVLGRTFAVIGGSEDQSVVYFMARQSLTPEDAAAGRTWDQSWALYKFKDGVVSNAGTLPPGNTVEARGSMSAGFDSPSPEAGNTNTSNLSNTLGNGHVVSRDGSRALFTDSGIRSVSEPPSQLYLHRDGQSSLLVSKRPEDPNEPASGAPAGVVPIGTFSTKGGATSANPPTLANAGQLAMGDQDLKVVVFATRDALVDGAPVDGTHVNTYRYHLESNELEYLPELDRPAETTSRNAPGNIYRINDDASRILFWTYAGEVKLWRDGLPTLTLATGIDRSSTPQGISGVRFAEDGKTLIFMSRQPVGEEPNHEPGGQPVRTQVYRFNEDEDAKPRCVSCPPQDALVKGPAAFDLLSPMNNGFGTSDTNSTRITQNRAISEDGKRVVFTTTSTLDPRDQNTTTDVYEWSADRGYPVLVSSGSPTSRGDVFLDMDASGRNIFFATEERLTASDDDTLYDTYVARIGGGLPDPEPFNEERECLLDSCQSGSNGAPKWPVVGSVAFRGSGNLSPADEKGVGISVSRTKVVRGAKAKLRVRVPSKGQITINGAYLRRVSRAVAGAGAYRLNLGLNARGRRMLAKRKSLTTRIKVRFRDSSGGSAGKTIRIAFKQSKKAGQSRKGGR